MRALKVLSAVSVLLFSSATAYGAPGLPASAPPVSSPENSVRVGIVAAVRGAVQIASSGQVGKITGSGQPVYLGDVISTDPAGSLQVLLLDETIFTIGPNSAITIDKFIYDPATHDGVLKASVVRGVFRFVTGKIGQKQPQQMEVDLPAGTIGIRGTIVAGEVEGKKSTVILLGPGENNNTGHRQGKFILSNESRGSLFQETVSKSGFGSIIGGEGEIPTKPFKISADNLSRITSALGPLTTLKKLQGPDPSEKISGEKEQSPTEQSGQAKAQGSGFVKQTGQVNRLVQKLGNESGQASQRIINSIGTNVMDGPTSRNQLQIAAQKFGGIQHFQKTNVALSGAQSGTANFYVDIDFGGRQIGGGNSKVNGTITSGTFQYNLGTRPFGFGDENAAFNYSDVPKAGGGSCTTCAVADIDLGVNNRGGVLASDANVSITIKQSPGGPAQSKGGDIAPRQPGAS